MINMPTKVVSIRVGLVLEELEKNHLKDDKGVCKRLRSLSAKVKQLDVILSTKTCLSYTTY